MYPRNNITILTSASRVSELDYFIKPVTRTRTRRGTGGIEGIGKFLGWCAHGCCDRGQEVQSSSKPERSCECPRMFTSFPLSRLPKIRSFSSEEQSAFFHSYEYFSGHKLGIIRLNLEVSERMSRDGLKEALHPRKLTIFVKPMYWLSYDTDGYQYSQSANSVYPSIHLCPFIPFKFCDASQGLTRTTELP